MTQYAREHEVFIFQIKTFCFAKARALHEARKECITRRVILTE